MSVACLWYLLATVNPHPNLSDEQINFSQQSDLPKCLKWLQKALFVLFFVVFRSFSRFLNSREFKFTVAFELFAFATTWLSTEKEFPWYTFFMRFLIDGRVIFLNCFQRNVVNIASHFNHRRK